METRPSARIVSYNQHGEAVCASAAKISTTQGGALDIFEATKDDPRNFALLQKVLRSGHLSVLEHAVFSIALWNVSAFTEQFFIEFRLASFTVKSRRYVDFGGQGYHIPPTLQGAAREAYTRYMDGLFDAYATLLELGAPKEDARFLLPYAFHSSFYCTLDARELVHLIDRARARGIPELLDIADQLAQQLEALFPNAALLLSPTTAPEPETGPSPLPFALIAPQEAGRVSLLAYPREPEALLEAAWRATHPGGGALPELEELLCSARPRALEQLSYSFSMADLTLPALTHLARHRMQSLAAPPLEQAPWGRYILPNSIARESALRTVYEEALEDAYRQCVRFTEDPALRRYGYYFLLSGTLVDVVTTMDARELELFLRLRTCERAQWEIRAVALRLRDVLLPTCPALFSRFGPACWSRGRCPEGALSCGRQTEVAARFS